MTEEEKARDLAAALKHLGDLISEGLAMGVCGQKAGRSRFCLLLFDFDGSSPYFAGVGNAEREEMRTVLRLYLQRLDAEADPPVTTTH